MDVNVLINKQQQQPKKDPMKPPSATINTIDDHDDGDHNDHHFVSVPFVHKAHMDPMSDADDPAEVDDDDDDDAAADDIQYEYDIWAILNTGILLNPVDPVDPVEDHDHSQNQQADEDYDDQEDYPADHHQHQHHNNNNLPSDPGVTRIRSRPPSSTTTTTSSSSPPPPSLPPTLKFNLKPSQQNNDYIIIIDDLFVRKLLHQICPEHFDETWLKRFKSQYLNSFFFNNDTNKQDNGDGQQEDEEEEEEELENVEAEPGSGDDYRTSTSKRKDQNRRQKRILEQILSTNQLTPKDEFLVYWKLDHHHHPNHQHQQQQPQHCHHDRDIFQNLKTIDVDDDADADADPRGPDRRSEPEPEESWLQHRDPMTYLYNFCELLMFLEMKFDGQKQKDRCQQLAREIRAYLYWISNDGRFKEDSVEQEQLARQSSSSSSSSSTPKQPLSASGSTQLMDSAGPEQKLFYSIVQHLLMICYELMMVTNATTTTTNNMVAELHHQRNQRQKQRFYQVFEGYFGKTTKTMIQQNDDDPTGSSGTPTTINPLTLYEQWMKNLKNILITLVDYYELNPQIKLQQQQRFDCNNHHHQQPQPPQPQQQQQQPNQNVDVILSSTTASASAIRGGASSSMATPGHSAAAAVNNSNSSGSGGSTMMIVPASSSSSQSSSPSLLSSSSSSATTTAATSSISSSHHHFNHLMAPLSSSSAASSSMAHNGSNCNNNNGNHHHHHNGTSSTQVERHSSTTSSSGPSSGVGSFDSSIHHHHHHHSSSNHSFHRELFGTPGSSVTGGGGGHSAKFLPSSASMAPSPANFTNAPSPLTCSTTTTTTTEDNNNNNFSTMLLQMNHPLDDLDLLPDTNPMPNQMMNDPHGRCPKLIAPPMVAHHRGAEANNNSNNNGGAPSSPTTFGFDFNSLNNPNRKEKMMNNNNRQPEPITFNQQQQQQNAAEFAFGTQHTTANGGGGANCSTMIGQVLDSNPTTNGSLFHDLNITSLFSSFDDTISLGAESGTITDFNTLATPNNNNHHHHHLSNSNNINSSAVGTTLAIKHYPDPSEESHPIQLPNQCFTMTLDQPKHGFGHHPQLQQQQQASAAIPKPLVLHTPKYGHQSSCPPLTTPPLIQHQNSVHQESTVVDELCERQTLYRLIISQLLFDGHRNIACQVAGSEHIKCDSFLIGPSQELHKLVTFAKAKKKEDILMDKSMDTPAAASGTATAAVNITPGFGRGANNNNSNNNCSGGYFDSAVGGSTSSHSLNTGNGGAQSSPTTTTTQTSPSFSLRVDDPYSKAIYDHHSVGSHLPQQQPHQQISPLFSNHSGGGASTSITPHTSTSTQNSASMLEYTDLNSSATDLYSPSSGQMEYYFNSNRSPEMNNSKISNQSHGLNDGLASRHGLMAIGGGVGVGARGGSMKCLAPSVDTPTTHPLANVVVGGNELVLTEACLKNINQLAKLNSSGVEQTSLTNQNNGGNPLLGTGPNVGVVGAGTGGGNNNQPIMFGRSASAMAMTTPNGMSMMANNNNSNNNINPLVPGPIGSTGNLCRSPLPIKSPTGYPATHTTGNGKSHQIMQIVYKFGSLGQLKSQFSSPHGFCLGMNDEIIIADTNNHRICSYDKNGVFKQMFGNPGKDEGQLWYPRKITMIPQNYVRNNVNSPYFVICDRGMERSRMQIFTRNGNFVRKIPIRYIDIVAGIAINNRGHIVVVDSVSPTIYVITIDNGTLIEWRDCGDYMREPSDVAIYDDDYYICDFKGHCVVVIKSNGDFVRKIGMEGLTSFPNGIDISPSGEIFVGDSHGNKFHVVVFNRDGRLLAEYECPYCKVSRCCGLKLTKDNCIVTLAKNNHHVLVLNPNFQPTPPPPSQSQLLQQLQQQSQQQQQAQIQPQL